MRRWGRSTLLADVGLTLWITGSQCCAQTSAPSSTGPVQGSLVDVANLPQFGFDALERVAATANQASYNALTSNPSGAVYCNPQQATASARCPTPAFLVFRNLRALVQTANALLANGQPTRYSLNITGQGLGNVMRWTAAEELLAPGSAATQFANSIAGVANRIAALRSGASGFSLAGLSTLPNGGGAWADNQPRALGGGASADGADIGSASRWGGFLNGSYGWGTHSPALQEDAFAFDSRDATLGVDYRFSRRLVLGAAAGYSSQRIDFNSALSVVGGSIHSNSYSVQLFGLYEWDGPYASMTLGAQRESYHSTRLITYPSQNIVVPPVNATAMGSTHSITFNAAFEVGWALYHKAFGFEPYLNGNYQHIHLAGFHESSVNNMGADAGQPAGFDFDFQARRIALFDTALGARFLYTISSPFGVAVPYVKAEYHHLFDNTPGSVVSSYNAIATSGAEFSIPSDKPTANFLQFAAGSTFVFGRRLQAFVQYQQSAHITNVTTRWISAGVRGEF
jgi:outer membrane lipase/esterase